MDYSVVLATYNGEDFIEEQLNSICKQSILPKEIIISDDNSNDETLNYVKKVITKYKINLKIISNNSNVGYSKNFERGLLQSKFDFIFLSDQDDYWFSNKVEKMFIFIQKNIDNFVWMNDAFLTDINLINSNISKMGQMRRLGLENSKFVQGCCSVISREFLEFALPIPKNISHDEWLIGVADILEMKKINTDILQFYRRHNHNSSLGLENSFRRVTILDLIKNLFNKLSYEEIYFIHSNWIAELENLKKRCPRRFLTKIEKNIILRKEFISSFSERIKIREKSFLLRIILAFKMFFNSGYKNSSGIKSMLRDIIG